MSSEIVNALLNTDRGCIRDHNEDFVGMAEPQKPSDEVRDGFLYIVADGVGGSDFGEVASEYATERTIFHYLDSYDIGDWRQRLVQAVEAANGDLRRLIAERGTGNRMATTLVATVIHGEWATIANVGDSRGYHWRDGHLEQITHDHSLVARLVEEGAITPEEAEHHPRKNVIIHSLGSENRPRIDVFDVRLRTNDRIILCSDGLTRHVSDAEIADAAWNNDLEAATAELVELAKERGGEDNISVGIVHYLRELSGIELDPETDVLVGPGRLAYAAPQGGQRALWLYTAILAIIQSLLIIWTWLIINS
ncbi:MAG: Stp1/IreP family PP2C-type Ser/Thr phosphatase [Candidatus Promineifilaceae bacterium]|jgi:serine/threonine protein phosphatase PrpC